MSDTHYSRLFHQIISDRTLPETESARADEDAELVCNELIAIRQTLAKFAKGNFDEDVTLRGTIGGCLKTLQANLRHLTWQVQQVAAGDFNQRVDFMGEFSAAFNSMVEQLERGRSELQQSEARWNMAVECSRDGIWDINLDTHEAWYSERLLEILQYGDDDPPLDLRWDLRIHPEDTQQAEFLRNICSGKEPLREFGFEARVCRKDGGHVWIRLRGMPVHENGKPTRRLIGVVSDITLQKEYEQALARQAMYDKLTGLPNRYLLDDRLKRMVATALRGNAPFALTVLDLDNFKGVNDTWGHAAGDKLLVEVGKRISSCLRESDTVARIGGDEFVFLHVCPPGEEKQATERILTRIYEAFKIPVNLGDVEYTIGSSAGAAFFPAHTSDVKKLFELADEALYEAKRRGKNTFAIWSPEIVSPEDS